MSTCELEYQKALTQIFRRKYVVDLSAEDEKQVERARGRWRRKQAKWREKQEDQRESR